MALTPNLGDIARSLLVAHKNGRNDKRRQAQLERAAREKFGRLITPLMEQINVIADSLGGNFNKLKLKIGDSQRSLSGHAVTAVRAYSADHELDYRRGEDGDEFKRISCYQIWHRQDVIFLDGIQPYKRAGEGNSGQQTSKSYPLKNDDTLSGETINQMIGDLVTAAFKQGDLTELDLTKLATFEAEKSAPQVTERVTSTGTGSAVLSNG